MPNYYAKLGPVDGTSADDFIFDFSLKNGEVTRLAPHHVRRTYSAVYAPVPVALTEHAPEEWKANNPIEIPIEFELVGTQQKDVDGELRKLRRFMKKSRKTGEPPDLLFVMGSKRWTVRIHRMEVTPTLWNDQTNEQRAKVSLTLHTTQAED